MNPAAKVVSGFCINFYRTARLFNNAVMEQVYHIRHYHCLILIMGYEHRRQTKIFVYSPNARLKRFSSVSHQ